MQLEAELNGVFQWGRSMTSVFSRTLSRMRGSDLPSPPWLPAGWVLLLVLGILSRAEDSPTPRGALFHCRGGGWEGAAVGESESGTKPAFLCLNPKTQVPRRRRQVCADQGLNDLEPGTCGQGGGCLGTCGQSESQCEHPTGTAPPPGPGGRQVMVPRGTLSAPGACAELCSLGGRAAEAVPTLGRMLEAVVDVGAVGPAHGEGVL